MVILRQRGTEDQARYSPSSKQKENQRMELHSPNHLLYQGSMALAPELGTTKLFHAYLGFQAVLLEAKNLNSSLLAHVDPFSSQRKSVLD